jgi:3'-5' exoribonuclease
MKTFVNEIKENETIDSFFLVKEKSFGLTKTGNAYLKLRLGDRSGEMEGRIWRSVDIFSESFDKDDFVQVEGKAVSFQEHLQINITHIKKVEEKEILFSDFFPMTEKDIDGMLQTLLSLTQLVLKNSNHYEGLNMDLLITGAILHDLGKVDELTYHRSFDYSDEGRLLGHIILGIERVEEKIHQLPDFPKDLSIQLKHLLLSHHGQYHWGSPKKPMTLEAVMLHFLDDMDAKINGIQQFLRTQTLNESRWSPYHPIFEQFFYIPNLLEEVELSNNIDENEEIVKE